MRVIYLILFISSCSQKITDEDMVTAYLERDTILIKSQERTEAMSEVLPKMDKVIEQEEKRIDQNIKTLKYEINESQNRTKVIYIHDTIVIKEKTNFWGRKRISTDSMQSIDSTEYQ